jgi:hypothetical protein
MNSKLMSADEKRNRKNELARIRRANGKQNSVVDTEVSEPELPESEPELPQVEPEPTTEEIEMKRKEAIAEKRRQSLILARSKIIPKNTIRKNAIDTVNKKDIELNNAKQEAEQIKKRAYEEAEATKKKAQEDIEVMKSLVKTKIISDAEPKKKEKVRSKSIAPRMRQTPSPPEPPPIQPQPVQPQQQNLIQMSYTEQLKQRLREQQLQRLMSDTFG